VDQAYQAQDPGIFVLPAAGFAPASPHTSASGFPPDTLGQRGALTPRSASRGSPATNVSWRPAPLLRLSNATTSSSARSNFQAAFPLKLFFNR
jgi:hypothetical protein